MAAIEHNLVVLEQSDQAKYFEQIVVRCSCFLHFRPRLDRICSVGLRFTGWLIWMWMSHQDLHAPLLDMLARVLRPGGVVLRP